MAYFSSVGPTFDGRMKPDISAPGMFVISAAGKFNPAEPHCEVIQYAGTSMATPVTAGMASYVREYFVQGFYPTGEKESENGFTPSGALLKAMLVHSGRPMKYRERFDWNTFTYVIDELEQYPSIEQGYGRLQLNTTLYFKDTTSTSRMQDLFVIGEAYDTTSGVNEYDDDWMDSVKVDYADIIDYYSYYDDDNYYAHDDHYYAADDDATVSSVKSAKGDNGENSSGHERKKHDGGFGSSTPSDPANGIMKVKKAHKKVHKQKVTQTTGSDQQTKHHKKHNNKLRSAKSEKAHGRSLSATTSHPLYQAVPLNASHSYKLEVTSDQTNGVLPLRITLAYTDRPAALFAAQVMTSRLLLTVTETSSTCDDSTDDNNSGDDDYVASGVITESSPKVGCTYYPHLGKGASMLSTVQMVDIVNPNPKATYRVSVHNTMDSLVNKQAYSLVITGSFDMLRSTPRVELNSGLKMSDEFMQMVYNGADSDSLRDRVEEGGNIADDDNFGSNNESFPPGAIAGIVIGSFVIIAGSCLAFFCLSQRRSKFAGDKKEKVDVLAGISDVEAVPVDSKAENVGIEEECVEREPVVAAPIPETTYEPQVIKTEPTANEEHEPVAAAPMPEPADESPVAEPAANEVDSTPVVAPPTDEPVTVEAIPVATVEEEPSAPVETAIATSNDEKDVSM